MKNNNLGIIDLLTLILITLKLTNQINWNWFEVFIPLASKETFYFVAHLIIKNKYK